MSELIDNIKFSLIAARPAGVTTCHALLGLTFRDVRAFSTPAASLISESIVWVFSWFRLSSVSKFASNSLLFVVMKLPEIIAPIVMVIITGC